MSSGKSSHILSTSSNLLGFCLVVLTSIKISKSGSGTIIDDVTGIAAVVLVISCILSFLAIRANNSIRASRFEAVADILFLFALICIAVTIVLVSLNVIA